MLRVRGCRAERRTGMRGCIVSSDVHCNDSRLTTYAWLQTKALDNPCGKSDYTATP